SLVVYNPLSASRRDTVEATVELSAEAPTAVRVVDRDSGRDMPAQLLEASGRRVRVLFLAELPAVGYKVFGVLPAAKAGSASSGTVTRSSEGQLLENSRYKVAIDARGDIASVVDKEAGRELLQGPVRLEMRDDPSPDKPAWRILYDTVSAPVREHVTSPATV